LNGDNKKMVWGEGLFRLFGIAPYSVQPTIEDFINFVHRDDQDQVRRVIETMIATPELPVPEIEFRIQNKGEEQTMRFSARHILGEQVSAFFGTIMDVTFEAQLKKQLQQVDTIMNLLLDTSGNRICVIDRQKKVIACNTSWEQFTGRAKKDIMGQDIINILPELEKDAELFKAINKGLEGNQSDLIREDAHWLIIPVLTAGVAGVMIQVRGIPVPRDGRYSSSINILQ
jgi:PAS domain-containing protein